MDVERSDGRVWSGVSRRRPEDRNPMEDREALRASCEQEASEGEAMKRIVRTFSSFRRRRAHVIWLAAAALLVAPAAAPAADNAPADPGVRCAARDTTG